MLKDMIRRRTIEIERKERRFFYDDNGGFGFPCDDDGNVLLNEMTKAAVDNYHWCLEHPEEFKHFNELFTWTERHHENANGVCSCGKRIELWDEYMGACECPHCGKWYNLFGQELKNPKYWSEGDDW